MKTKLYLRLALLAALDVAFVVTLFRAFVEEDTTLVTVTCLFGAIAHTHLAPTAKELATILTGKKS